MARKEISARIMEKDGTIRQVQIVTHADTTGCLFEVFAGGPGLTWSQPILHMNLDREQTEILAASLLDWGY